MALVIRNSRIHRSGCYTTAPIRKRTHIVEYTGPYLTTDEADELYEDREETYLYGLSDGKTVIDGDGIAAFVNHCCDPNCEIDEIDGHVWIIALRNIKPNEELTYDYNLYDGDDDAPCYCGARNCRGSMYSEEELAKKKAAAKKKKKASRRKR
jgi:hypothetical protein